MSKPRDLGLTLIAVAKLCKVVVLVTVGVMMLSLADHDAPTKLHRWATMVGIHPTSRHLHQMMEKLAGASQGKLHVVTLASFVYAAVFAVEGIGLWLQKRWGEWLTIVVTSSFMPFEVYEMVREPHWQRIIALVLNAAAVV
ncbi:MAG: putative rane protein, partial [Myxococcaceae bacterium]|nr:putative rane protein [Myxococcaceae bacterium]